MRYCIAIDVAKKDCMISLFSMDTSNEFSVLKAEIKPKKYDSNNASLNSFLEEVKKSKIVCSDVVMEATGCYHQKVMTFFKNGGYNVYILNPLLTSIKNKDNGSIRKQKDDKVDCKKIAETFLKGEYNVQRNYCDTKIYDLKMLSRYIMSLENSLSYYKVVLRNYLQYTNPAIEMSMNNQILFSIGVLAAIKELPHADSVNLKRVDGIVGIMKEEMKRCTREKEYRKNAEILKQLSKDSIASVDKDSFICKKIIPDLVDKILTYQRDIETLEKQLIDRTQETKLYEVIYSYNGIGKPTAAKLTAEIGDIEDYSSYKKLVAAIGLDPRIDQSGTSINIKRSISKKGNAYARTILFNAVEAIIMYEVRNKLNFPDSISAYYIKKHNDEHKHHYAAIIACESKLLKRIFYRYKATYLTSK